MSLRNILAAAAAIAAILMCTWVFSAPAMAQYCEFTMESAIASIAPEPGFTYVVVEGADAAPFVALAEAAAGAKFENVTRVLVAQYEGIIGIGVEVGGCLSPPIFVNTGEMPKNKGTPA